MGQSKDWGLSEAGIKPGDTEEVELSKYGEGKHPRKLLGLERN